MSKVFFFINEFFIFKWFLDVLGLIIDLLRFLKLIAGDKSLALTSY
jgi:hypothetical protein